MFKVCFSQNILNYIHRSILSYYGIVYTTCLIDYSTDLPLVYQCSDPHLFHILCTQSGLPHHLEQEWVPGRHDLFKKKKKIIPFYYCE